MSRALTVSRAAQLVGVSRAVLQRMIGAGELAHEADEQQDGGVAEAVADAVE